MRKQVALLLLLLACVAADVKLVSREFDSQGFTNSDVVDWTVTGNYYGQLTSICGKQAVFGGFNVFGNTAAATKSYDSGVNHEKLYITFDLYTIDSWDNEYFKVYIDGVEVYSFTTQYNQKSVREANCGWDAFGDRLSSVSIVIPHFRRQFTLKLTSTLDQPGYDESWGIRNLEIVAQYDKDNITVISEEFSASNFVASTTDWEIVGTDKGKEFSECGKTKLFGGYNTFGRGTIISKNYKSLPGHYGVVINMDLWMIDSPDADDSVQIIVDGQIYKFLRPDWVYTDAANFICGVPGWSEKVATVSIFVPHRGTSINLSIRGSFNEGKDNESFGITNLQVLTSTCSSKTCSVVTQEFNTATFAAGKDWKDDAGTVDTSSTIATCGAPASANFFGPHKASIQKTYTNLPTHSGVRFFFRLLTSGNWAANTAIKVLVDNSSANPVVASLFVSGKQCTRDDETVRNYFIDVPHSNSELNLRFILDNSYIDSNFSIRDLTFISYVDPFSKPFSSEFDGKGFDATTWTVAGQKGTNLVQQCDKFSLFGGFNSFGPKTQASRTYKGLPKHTFVTVSLQVFFLDTWDREAFTVKIDDEVVSVSTKAETWNGMRQYCGLTVKDDGYFIKVYYPHTADTLKITLVDALDQQPDDESWGVNNISISTGDFKLPKTPSSGSAPGPDPTGGLDGTGAGTGSTPVPTSGPDTCIHVFTDCDYKGTSLAICDNIPNLKVAGWNVPIKSIQIPEGKSINIFTDSDFQGTKKSFSASEACLSGKKLFLINKAFGIDVEEAPRQRLRVQKESK